MRNRMNTRAGIVVALVAIVLGASTIYTRAMADESAKKPAAKSEGFSAIQALEGTWIAAAPAEGQKPMTLVFRPTAGGSAMMETMSPGSEHEMLNVYTNDERGVTLTHYCMMGNQPRMRLASAKDGVLKFEYVDGGNLKSRDEAHMDSVEITIKGDRLTQDWAMYQDGKVTGHHTFEFKRQK
ncbi:MAG TPA: hypothetical protein VGQ99_15840 [Tepidisphaeraceae bacterium]|jgi:hypothetical protein|nr:hypothetical protein [Tepidisphaeraceae bacterium]